MNHAERVKCLAQKYAEAVGASVISATYNWESNSERMETSRAAFNTAIDAMQSALDDANAKLAARDAEVERLRVAVKQAFMEGFYSPETYNDTVVNDANECWEKAKSLILGTNSHAVLSEEVKGGV